MDAHASVMALAASCLVWSLIDPQSRPFLKGVQMPNYSPELIHTMRAALDEVIPKSPWNRRRRELKRPWLNSF